MTLCEGFAIASPHHAPEHGIPADEQMIEGGPDMEDDEGRQREGAPDVNREEGIGQGPVRVRPAAGRSKSP